MNYFDTFDRTYINGSGHNYLVANAKFAKQILSHKIGNLSVRNVSMQNTEFAQNPGANVINKFQVRVTTLCLN